MTSDKDKEIARLRADVVKFCTFIIEVYDSDDPSSMTQLFMRGTFGGASIGSLVEYAKERRVLAGWENDKATDKDKENHYESD